MSFLFWVVGTLALQDKPVVKDPPTLGPGEKLVAQINADPGATWSLLGIAPDGSAAAWKESKDGKFSVVWNGGRVDDLERVDPYCAWKDKALPVFKVAKNTKAFILMGADFSEGFDSVSDPVLSPSRKSVGFVAREKPKVWVVNTNHKMDVLNVQESTLVFAPDEQLFCVASLSTSGTPRTFAFLGSTSKELKGYLGGQLPGPVAFNADGVIAYTLLGGGTVQTTEGYTGPSFDRAASLRFSEDGKVVAYFVESKEGNKSKKQLVVQGVVGPTKYDEVAGVPGMSREGKVVAYIAKKGTKWVVAQDTKFSDAYDVIRPRIGDVDQPVVSGDGRSVAFVAEKQGKSVLIVNNRVMAEESYISAPVLNFNGSTVTYGLVSKQNVVWKLVAVPGR